MTQMAVHNPHDRPLADLPIIYGFVGSTGLPIGPLVALNAQLLAEDGTPLGGHTCSDEYYVPGDLQLLEGPRHDSEGTFKEHYPDGYRMEFVPMNEIEQHDGLAEACRLSL